MTELLEARRVSRSAHVLRTAEQTTIYLGHCGPCDRPVRDDYERDYGRTASIHCPDCGALVTGQRLAAVTRELVCDGACMSARRNFCACGCGGVNHGRHWALKLGTSEVIDAALDKYREHQRKVAARREQRQQAKVRQQRDRWAEFAEEHRDVIGWLRAIDTSTERGSFVPGMVEKIERHEILSGRMLEICEKIITERAERDARRARREAEDAAAQPVPLGKALPLAGEVVQAEYRDGYMDGTSVPKMLVRLDEGGKIWATVPDTLLGQAHRDLGTLTGCRVEFTADVKLGKSADPKFGIAVRPRAARILARAGEVSGE
jgi:hypothetical protein